jgi:hypothetical protein
MQPCKESSGATDRQLSKASVPVNSRKTQHQPFVILLMRADGP